jgi:hypothetical protein
MEPTVRWADRRGHIKLTRKENIVLRVTTGGQILLKRQDGTDLQRLTSNFWN